MLRNQAAERVRLTLRFSDQHQLRRDAGLASDRGESVDQACQVLARFQVSHGQDEGFGDALRQWLAPGVVEHPECRARRFVDHRDLLFGESITPHQVIAGEA